MTFADYQEQSRRTALYPAIGDSRLIYPVLGLTGEAGEVAEKVKKIFRDNGGVISDEKKQELSKELGDVLWYLSQIASELGLSLADVAQLNLDKLSSRFERDQLHGSGDNR